MIVSFSGIDGAGKTTQILELDFWLNASGLRTTLITFWDDVVVFPRCREFLSRVIFHGDQGIGSIEKPVNRRDKNVTSWPLAVIRFLLYLADAMSLAVQVRKLRGRKTDVVIFDRYIHDELANLPLKNSISRAFARLVLSLTPDPDVAYVIDAEPMAAQARKPEYPLEFVRRNRAAYLALAELSGTITVIPPGSINVMQRRIRQEMLRGLWTGRSSTLATNH